MSRHFTRREITGEAADLDPSFDTWKFWLSSAAIFAGVVASALLPSCAKAAEAQPQSQAWSVAHVQHPTVDPPAAARAATE
jgi:hypothetical protein